ncbi:MAG: preprotein translocase subunit SecE [Candidatus Yanofskybacteria bacterium]|nr:preprotein translocase subunit SecE [Candidatus Yanofskybacteria bacterium]
MNRILTFLKEVRIELAKVSWPTRKQIIVYTAVVIGLSLFFAVILGVLDIFYEFLVNTFLVN